MSVHQPPTAAPQPPTASRNRSISSPYTLIVGLLVAFGLGTMTAITLAGDLNPPGPPADTMYTLSDLYNLASGTTSWLEGRTIVTGQDTCYDASGTLISCSGTGQDGETQTGLSFSYTDNGDDTVLDNNTGLTWEQGYSTTTYNWTNALKYCNENWPNLAGSGWRLPNIKELITLVDYGISATVKIDTIAFPGTPASFFWSATTFPNSGSQSSAMLVYFNFGSVSSLNKTSSNYVRCVRD